MLTENNLRRIVREIIIESESSFHPELGKYLTKGLERAYDIERGVKKGGSYKKSGSGKENPKIEDLLFSSGKLSELKPASEYDEEKIKKEFTDEKYKNFFINLYRFLSNSDDYDVSKIYNINKNDLKEYFKDSKKEFYKHYKEKVDYFIKYKEKVIPDFAKYIIKLFED
jgi:hypothetical protein